MTINKLTKKKEPPLLKYNIENHLKQLSKEDYDLAVRLLPQELDISKRQFYRYRKAPLNNPNNTIDFEKLRTLAFFFGVSMEELINTPLYQISIEKLRIKENQGLGKELR